MTHSITNNQPLPGLIGISSPGSKVAAERQVMANLLLNADEATSRYGGHVAITSEVGKGTTIDIYLPVYAG